MKAVRKWLNSSKKVFSIGVALYNTYGDNAALKDALKQGYSEYRLNRITTELSKIAAGTPEPEPEDTVAENSTPPPVAIEPKQHTKKDDDPYQDEWKPLYQEMQLHRHRIRDVSDKNERGQLAMRILELEGLCNFWWERRDYYQINGVMMPEEDNTPDPFVDMNQLVKKRNTLRTYVSRYKKKCKDQPDNAGYRNKLDDYTQQLKEIEEQIDG